MFSSSSREQFQILQMHTVCFADCCAAVYNRIGLDRTKIWAIPSLCFALIQFECK